MALQKTLKLTSNLGDEADVVCYIRVKFVNSTKQAVICQYDILRDGQERVIETRQFCFDANVQPDAANIWTQCYAALKALPEFAGAADV
jgi:hypothetical protein